MKVIIRQARVADIPKYLAVKKQGWLETYPNKRLGITREMILSRDFLSVQRQNREKENFKNKKSRTWVALLGQKMLGVCGANKQKEENSIYSMYILSKFHRQGVGSLMLKNALKWLENKKPISLVVAKYNNNAINFYKKFGFVKVGNTPGIKMPNGKRIPSFRMVRFKNY